MVPHLQKIVEPKKIVLVASSVEGMTPINIGKWIALVLGALGTLYSIVTIASDITGNGWRRYTYEPPFTAHEAITIIILIISIIACIVGVCLLVPKPKPSMQKGLWIGFGISLILCGFLPFWLPCLILALRARPKKNTDFNSFQHTQDRLNFLHENKR